MEYNKMINDKLKENQLRAIRHYPQPMMFGGVRFLTNHPLHAGNPANGPHTLSTGDPYPNMSLEYSQGGNMAKSLKKIGKSIQKVGNKTIKAVGEAIPKMTTDTLNNAIVPALSKYGEKALTNYLMPAVEEGAEIAVAGSRRRGRPRKLTKKQVEDVIDEFKGGSFKSVMKKVGKVANKVVNKAIPMAEKYAMNGLKTAVMDYALPAAEVGAETVAANPELLLLAAGRKGRFKKGSQAAKDHMAKIRAMRKK